MEQQRPSGGIAQFLMIFMFMLALLVVFDPSLRSAMGNAVGYIFWPTISFGNRYPIWTIFFCGIITVTLSTTIRHYFIDWVETAKAQKQMSAFSKEFRKAQLSNNTYKIKKLTEMQPEIMAKQSKLMMSQMKPMGFTMVIIIAIFTWLWLFIEDLSSHTITLPWEANWDLEKFFVLPNWIFIYSLISIPFGQVLQRALKLLSFKKRLSEVP